GLADLAPKTPMSLGGTTLVVAGSEVYDAFANDTVHRTIEVVTTSGAVSLRQVSSVTLVSGDSVITVSVPWGFDIPLNEVRRISWMTAARFGSDTLTVEWVTDEVAQAALSIRSLEAAP